MSNRIVIIGGVAAGSKAAAKARRQDPTATVTVYSAERYIAYSACGLPYYIEDIVKDSNRLLIRTPEVFKSKDNVDIHILHMAEKIDPHTKTVTIKNLQTEEVFDVPYDKLLIATGASPFVPDIPGVNLNGVYYLRSVSDGIAIKDKIPSSTKAVVAGGGLIGLETLEAFHHRGLEVILIEFADQILTSLDKEMADIVQKYLEEEIGVKIYTNAGCMSIVGNEKVAHVETTNGQLLDADIVLLSIGVRPNVKLAKDSGIELGSTGAIKVNEYMQTNYSDIYAAGDCAEQIHKITGSPTWVPLGSTANKQGRVAAVNMTGGSDTFDGVIGSLVTKVFDFTVSKTGLSEKEAKKLGMDILTAKTTYRDRAGYMPGANTITIKMLADKNTHKLLGAQIVGKGDADKRMYAMATALTAGMTIEEFSGIDFTYAPPFSPSIEPLLIVNKMLLNED